MRPLWENLWGHRLCRFCRNSPLRQSLLLPRPERNSGACGREGYQDDVAQLFYLINEALHAALELAAELGANLS